MNLTLLFPSSLLPEGRKLQVMEELPGGLKRRKIQLHREALPGGRNPPVPLPASGAQAEPELQSRGSLSALPRPAGEQTLPCPTPWALLAMPSTGFVSSNSQLSPLSLQGHGPSLGLSDTSSQPTFTRTAPVLGSWLPHPRGKGSARPGTGSSELRFSGLRWKHWQSRLSPAAGLAAGGFPSAPSSSDTGVPAPAMEGMGRGAAVQGHIPAAAACPAA